MIIYEIQQSKRSSVISTTDRTHDRTNNSSHSPMKGIYVNIYICIYDYIALITMFVPFVNLCRIYTYMYILLLLFIQICT
jgi:hypothetical protein